ncbi:hypothetical protein JBE38_24555 [Pseudomonas sp. ICBG1301]|uniref:EamA family transporter n=1 Tax=Pseudomonas sp. ICBG1301 TaxID=2795987 RepID=UPI00196617CD|nr:hypothetical protein [Pseudomonas sp. ICBG1301]MBM9489111.1 hypothetical protein [Pseudomonas sp. ICBG1301]
MKTREELKQSPALAMLLAGFANFFLGLSSLYWREFRDTSPTTIVAYRIILSAATLILFFTLLKHMRPQKIFNLSSITLHCIASFFVAINWGAFIGSSINGYFLESAIGYLLAPFISIIGGAIMYHEPLNLRKLTLTIIALALTAVLIIFNDNLNHLTYLTISTSWGFYTYIKKKSSLNAINGLFIETLFLTTGLITAIYLFSFPVPWPSRLPSQSGALIWLAGAVSVAPLLMFSHATGKLPLSPTGFLQFILPLTLTVIGVFFYQEVASTTALASTIAIISILITLLAYDTLKTRAP